MRACGALSKLFSGSMVQLPSQSVNAENDDLSLSKQFAVNAKSSVCL